MTDTSSTDFAFEDLPEGDWFVEARSGDTVARLLFSHKLLPFNGHDMGAPRVVVLTPRPRWSGAEARGQADALLVDGNATFVEEAPFDVADPIVTALAAEGVWAAQAALAKLLEAS